MLFLFFVHRFNKRFVLCNNIVHDVIQRKRRAPIAYSAIGAISDASKTVSRVLYLTVIYLGALLPVS